jgi:predicted dehydrogenase
VLVRATPEGPGAVTVYAAGVQTSGPVPGPDGLGQEAVAFVRAVAAGQPAPYPLDDALATMRLAERVMAALR